MIGLSELKRRLENIVQVGTIGETKSAEGKALARVVLDDSDEDKRVSKFLPVVSIGNSFMRVWIPIKVGEQVLVISPFGNSNSGFIIRSIFNRSCKEPTGANEHTTVIEFDDGTIIHYDSKASELKIDVLKTVNIICQEANITADIFNINADETNINGVLNVTDDINCDGTISDELGDLTNHPHSDSDGGTSRPR
ncbi:phage baseplate assembly protein V [Sulfurimonas sp.]|uniref:phage baseplate assembly protein V n=1 Tax=Sulfurimonas sp. TaxID=2022749 RepID=UPI0025F1F7E2|nr:phage baseplate assembly protein V [Sulfurimonas sp.]